MAKVMLVEDDPTMLSLLDTLLGMEGFEVDKITNFSKVLEEINKSTPNVVLMDVNLKEANGIELLEEIRKDKKLNGLAVIMSSGMDFSDECLSKGANDFLLKPYMPDELIEKINKIT